MPFHSHNTLFQAGNFPLVDLVSFGAISTARLDILTEQHERHLPLQRLQHDLFVLNRCRNMGDGMLKAIDNTARHLVFQFFLNGTAQITGTVVRE